MPKKSQINEYSDCWYVESLNDVKVALEGELEPACG